MKKIILITIFLATLMACETQKSVELPKADHTEITTMENYSPVYFFYNTAEKDSLELNRKNLISSTNWVFHIDKKFSLKQMIPTLKMLQQKKIDAVHKDSFTKNYLTIHNTSIENLGFIDFQDTEYVFDSDFSKFYIDSHPEKFEHFFPISVNFKSKDSITIDGTPTTLKEMNSFIKEFADFSTTQENTALVFLNFESHLSYQDYITFLTHVQTVASKNINISPKQFIYTESKLPDCGCTL